MNCKGGGKNYHGLISIEMIMYPSILKNLLKQLNDGGLICDETEKEKGNFDFFGNNEFHPIERIKFLSNLVFSSLFGVLLHLNKIESPNVYNHFQSKFNQLCDNFDLFCKEWYLDSYKMFENNNEEKRYIWKSFKNATKLMFYLSQCYYMMAMDNSNENNSSSSNISNNANNRSANNIYSDDKEKLYEKLSSFRRESQFVRIKYDGTKDIQDGRYEIIANYARSIDCLPSNLKDIKQLATVCHELELDTETILPSKIDFENLIAKVVDSTQ